MQTSLNLAFRLLLTSLDLNFQIKQFENKTIRTILITLLHIKDVYKDCEKLPPFTPIFGPHQVQVQHTPPHANVKTIGHPTIGHPTIGQKTDGKPIIGPVFSKEEILSTKPNVPHVIHHVPIRGKSLHSTTPPGPNNVNVRLKVV